ncbi:hypothetical protein [Paenarthrobacter nitroguajacolicus]|uniref:hypothetical protein n=1 Tax=Paenarthrobacter nitroguajacolicus TaxID=211146 RepID=UPI0028650747|nr:hypothetical protein [Paenarthrobacter nitroguajacolicus]MDR6639780.1 hypothetical protein [Paenarthrobacter nitroguajacolicus]
MNYRRTGHAKYATLVSLALALTLTACTPSSPEPGGAPTERPAASPQEVLAETVAEVDVPVADAAPVAPTPAAEPAPLVIPEPAVVPVVAQPVSEAPAPAPTVTVEPAPAVTAPPTEPVVTPITPLEPSTPHVSPNYPEIGTYTFPDGHISFEVPTGWGMQAEVPVVAPGDDYPYDDHFAIAHIFDENGHNVVDITSGGVGGVVAGPVNRTILDSQKLSSFDSRDGASYFAVFRDDYPFEPAETRYFVGLVPETLMTEGPDSTSAASFLIMGNGATTAHVNIDPFMTQEAAEAWMQSGQYSKLKGLLTSLRYAQ